MVSKEFLAVVGDKDPVTEFDILVKAECKRSGRSPEDVLEHFQRFVESQKNIKFDDQLAALTEEGKYSVDLVKLGAFMDYVEDVEAGFDTNYIGYSVDFDEMMAIAAERHGTDHETTLDNFWSYVQEEFEVKTVAEAQKKFEEFASVKGIPMEEAKALAVRDFIDSPRREFSANAGIAQTAEAEFNANL